MGLPNSVLSVLGRVMYILYLAALTFGALSKLNPVMYLDLQYLKHPTLLFEAQTARCDWKVWFEGGKRPAYVAALNKFSEVSGIPWVEVRKESEASVIIYMLKDNKNKLGMAYRDSNPRVPSTISMNIGMLPQEKDLTSVTLHEVLHVFGLYHSNDTLSLMHKYYNPNSYLTNEDLNRITMLAGTC